ncbi:MAG: hypothetical protein V5A57_03360 [Candidatus Paceibacterota bacterium]
MSLSEKEKEELSEKIMNKLLEETDYHFPEQLSPYEFLVHLTRRSKNWGDKFFSFTLKLNSKLTDRSLREVVEEGDYKERIAEVMRDGPIARFGDKVSIPTEQLKELFLEAYLDMIQGKFES